MKDLEGATVDVRALLHLPVSVRRNQRSPVGNPQVTLPVRSCTNI